MTHNTIKFPPCFSGAKSMLQIKFKGNIDSATIEDSIQYAKIEFWRQGIQSSITDDHEAFGWFLKVAQRYLYKEINRLKKNCSILQAIHLRSEIDYEKQFYYREFINSLGETLSEKRSFALVKHASGYSLKEMAESEHISLDAMKQIHARQKRIVKRKAAILFY
jgi:hypothetical protein